MKVPKTLVTLFAAMGLATSTLAAPTPHTPAAMSKHSETAGTHGAIPASAVKLHNARLSARQKARKPLLIGNDKGKPTKARLVK